MIKITDSIWIGSSDDERTVALWAVDENVKLTGVLNVARDLANTHGSVNLVEYAHVGLIDGPGNTHADYCAAILALVGLLDRHKSVMVCCHSGTRSLAIVIMYSILKKGNRPDPVHVTFLSCWTNWDDMLAEIEDNIEVRLPIPHKAHKEAFDTMPLSLLEMLL